MTERVTDATMFDSRGHRRTASLFVEVTQDSNLPPVYTMKDHSSDPALISAYAVYMSSIDEYEAAMRLTGSMVHWRKLCQAKWFMDGDMELGFTGLNDWRKDMAMRDRSKATRTINDQLGDGDLRAANLLLDIAAGKKDAPTKKSAKSTTPRRGTQTPGNVVDIASLAAKIKPE